MGTEDRSLSTCLCPRTSKKLDEHTCSRNSSEDFFIENQIKKEEESLNYTLIFSLTGSSALLIIFIAGVTTLYLVRRRSHSNEENQKKEAESTPEAEAMLATEEQTPV